jgi:hypothetical protein
MRPPRPPARLGRLVVVSALAGLATLGLAGCSREGAAHGRASPPAERPAGPAYDGAYQGSGSFAYAGVGEYDGEQVRHSDPGNILNAGYDNAY